MTREESARAFQQALAAFSRGELAEAERACQAALAAAPGDARALHLSAAVAMSSGRTGEALGFADAAIAANPRDATQYQTRGQVLRALGRAADAERDFRHAIALDSRFADAHAALGAWLLSAGRAGEGRQYLLQALQLRPGDAQSRYNLALCDFEEGRLDEAEAGLERLLAERPEWAEARNVLGALLVRQGKPAKALEAIREALRLSPRMHLAWNNLGLAQIALGELRAALESFQRCLQLEPRDATGWTHLANVMRALGDRDGAEKAYRTATQRGPNAAPAWQNLGNLLREMGRHDEAIECLERAVSLAPGTPETHLSLAHGLLASGKLERGWREYGWRNGSPPAGVEDVVSSARRSGTLVLEGEQGLGDALFFLRWAALPAWHEGFALQWGGDPRLTPLLAGLALRGASTAAGMPRLHAGDLPRAVGPSAASHPPSVVIPVDSGSRDGALRELASAGPPPYAAVAWRAGSPPKPGEDLLSKAVPLEPFARSLAAWKGTLVCLQRHPAPVELDLLRSASKRPVFDATAWNEDLARMAALLAAVDLYVGVSSTNVHIAAGVGLAARILVPQPPEWRYAGTGAESPWFPGYALHREDARLGWEGTLEALSRALAATPAP